MIDSSLRLNFLLFKRQTQIINERLLFFVVNNAELQSAMQYAVLHQHESFLQFVLDTNKSLFLISEMNFTMFNPLLLKIDQPK